MDVEGPVVNSIPTTTITARHLNLTGIKRTISIYINGCNLFMSWPLASGLDFGELNVKSRSIKERLMVESLLLGGNERSDDADYYGH